MAEIVAVTVRMYQVGFGDCFLLSFDYRDALPDGRNRRHILVDFGSTRLPAGRKPLARIAGLLHGHSDGGQIDVVVVTHRHKDHLSAFGDDEVVGALMADGFPRLVVRSWTEDPDLDSSATHGAHAAGAGAAGAEGAAGSAVGERSIALLRQLRAGAEFATTLRGALEGAAPGSLAATVAAVADQVANPDAVRQLATWSEGGKGRYLHYGTASGIEDVVPGLKVRVLGPPTVEQHEAVQGQRSADDDEFWMIYQGLVAGMAPDELLVAEAAAAADSVPDPATPDDDGVDHTGRPTPGAEAPSSAPSYGEPGPRRWLTDRMARQNLFSLMRIVRILDDVLNNTSLILLFEVPTATEPLRLLFPGDAQIENWEYALKFADDRDEVRDLLREVDLYKVGHHGSRNATPRTLFNLWSEPGKADRPLVALMSTRSGVHGKAKATAVPRETLVAALDTRTGERLFSTEGILTKRPYVEAVVDTTAGNQIAVTDGSRSEAHADSG